MKESFISIDKIINRAETMGITRGNRITQFLDLDHANTQFNLRLADLIAADDFNFSHDFTGIQEHMNRTTGKIDDGFMPRYSSQRNVEERDMVHTSDDGSEYILIPIYEEAQANGCYQVLGYRKEYI